MNTILVLSSTEEHFQQKIMIVFDVHWLVKWWKYTSIGCCLCASRWILLEYYCSYRTIIIYCAACHLNVQVADTLWIYRFERKLQDCYLFSMSIWEEYSSTTRFCLWKKMNDEMDSFQFVTGEKRWKDQYQWVLGLVTLLYRKVVKDMTFNRGVIFVMF